MFLQIAVIFCSLIAAPSISRSCNFNRIKLVPTLKSNRPQRQVCVQPRCDIARRQVLSWGLSLISGAVGKDTQGKTTYLSPSEGGEDVVVYALDSGLNNGLGKFKHRVRVEDVSGAEVGRRFFDHYGHEHGSYVAQIIGSEEIGVAPNAEVVVVKIFNGQYISMQNVYDGLKFVERDIRLHGKKAVINMSIGFDLSFCKDPTQVHIRDEEKVQRLMKRLIDQGVIIVKAAGNAHADAISDPLNRVPGVIVVGAINEENEIEMYSNNGKLVNMFAPGRIHKYKQNMWSFVETDEEIMGTSFAAPFVAGVAALYLSAGIHNVHDALFESAHKEMVKSGRLSVLRGAVNRIVNSIPMDYVK